jgi:crotonobetainyl-CoA:carnitine CoA-transferase CaiB-like acyl-CoA transferase
MTSGATPAERGQSVTSRGFLAGVRVIELADELGEFCGKLLAGLGADVIKVEPLGGEGTRHYGPFYRETPHPNQSLYFWHYNFGKRGSVIDIDTESGCHEFRRLVGSADVLLDTRHRDYLNERGVGYEQLAADNPGLVYARVSPFGDDGPWADYQGSDLVHLALGGVMLNCGYDPTPLGEHETPPVAPQMWQSYQITGEVCAIAIIAALYSRTCNGRGQRVSVSVHDAVSKNTETDLPDWVYQHAAHIRVTGKHSVAVSGDSERALRPPAPGMVATKDGRWVLPYQTYLGEVGSPIEAVFALLGENGIDPGMDPDVPRSADDLVRLNELVAHLIGGYTSDRELWRDAQQHGLPWAPVRRPEENLDDPHWRMRGSLAEVEYPELSQSFTQVAAKWYAPEVPWRSGPRAPMLGEHTAEVLHECEQPRVPAEAVATQARDIRGSAMSPLGKPWALGGVRVIDLGWILASAGGGRFLAALGAEVIKVEHQAKPDLMRVGGTRVPDGLRAERESATGPIFASMTTSLNRGGGFMEINAGKRAISLNLKSERGRELLKELLKDADVLVEGFSPDVMNRMGLGYDVLREINPRLVYVQQTGMGQYGRYGRLKCFGPTAQAFSGLTEMSGLPEPYPPAGIGYSYLDWVGAYQFALAMVAGLYRQRMTGNGCWIDSSQVEAGLYFSGTTVLHQSANGQRWARYGNRSPYKRAAPHGAFRVQGTDRWIAIAAFTQEEWTGLARVLDHPEWTSDARFATLDLRIANQDALEASVQDATQRWNGIELMEALQAGGVPAGICQTAEDRYEWDPQLRHLGWLVDLEQTETGSWPTKTAPYQLSATPTHQGGLDNRHAPNYGEDNAYVYRELLGMSREQIDVLAGEGVI